MILDKTIIIYFFVFFVGCWNVIINTKTSNNLFFFLLFLLSALRKDVGYDYMSYSELIDTQTDYLVNRLEFIDRYLIIWSNKFFPQLFFIVNAFISVYFTKWALQKLSPNTAVSGLLFMCFPLLFLYTLNVVRFGSALAILFYASTYIFEKKFLKYIVFQLIALLFHNGAIIGLLFIPLYFLRIKYTLNIFILIFSFIGGEVVLSYIAGIAGNIYIDQFLKYAERETGEGLSKIPYVYLAIDVLLLIAYKTFSKKKYVHKYLTLFNIGVSIMFLFSFNSTLGGRLSLPFLYYILMILPTIISPKPQLAKGRVPFGRVAILFAVCLFFLTYSITIYNISLGRSQYLPYQFFFLT